MADFTSCHHFFLADWMTGPCSAPQVPAAALPVLHGRTLRWRRQQPLRALLEGLANGQGQPGSNAMQLEGGRASESMRAACVPRTGGVNKQQVDAGLRVGC
ncbi:unnamed protein product [Urochloa humidicola]